jgi:hypothetical protein
MLTMFAGRFGGFIRYSTESTKVNGNNMNLKLNFYQARAGNKRMKTFCVLVLSLGCAAITGCMHTVIGGGPHVSPDKKYALGVTMHGASAKAFTALTKKRVYLWIATTTQYDSLHLSVVSNSVPLLDKKYVFVAADLRSKVQWQPEGVSVTFYDYGDGVLSGDARKTGVPSNHVASLFFHRDTKTGRFVEAE